VTADSGGDNIVSDPPTGLSYTWNARNQLTTISGGISNTFDAIGRRSTLTNTGGFQGSQYFLHDGASVAAWQYQTEFANFMTPPGGGAPAMVTYTVQGNQTVCVPVNDIFGSTIAMTGCGISGLQATYTYDPSGILTITNGARTPWPFLFHGLEQEPDDSLKLYMEPNGNFYNPDPFELSISGPQGLSAGGSGPGSIGAPRSSGGGPSLLIQNDFNQSGQSSQTRLQATG
jgi:hypothetical protein